MISLGENIFPSLTRQCGLKVETKDIIVIILLLYTSFSCGLVALNLAADILKTSTGQIETNDIQELLKVAQESGFTYRGEMFSAQDMGLLANKYYGLKFNILNNALDDYVKLVEHLCQGYPVLAPYDEDRNHEPCLKRGHKAHWAIITGRARLKIKFGHHRLISLT